MPYLTDAELVEIVPGLRAWASVETTPEVRFAMIRLADRYAAMATECQAAGQLIEAEFLPHGSDDCADHSTTGGPVPPKRRGATRL
jgi:hypothetical protein